MKFFYFLLMKEMILFTPMAAMTGMHQMQGYNNFWDGALGGRGYWGRTPATRNNIFSSNFDDKGYMGMYNLNSFSPFAQHQSAGFDTMTPYFTPNGTTKYSYYPTKSNYLSNEQLGAFAYDINEPRYAELYKQYYKFFNTDLDRLQLLQKFKNLDHNLNHDKYRKILNPKSFDYQQYFDGYDSKHSMPGLMNKLKFQDKQPKRNRILI